MSKKYFLQLSTNLSELFYIAVQKLPALIPSLQRFTQVAVESGQGGAIEQLLQAADEGELQTVDGAAFDKNGRYHQKYEGMTTMNIEANFTMLSLKLEIAWHSYTREKISAVGSDAEVGAEMRRLTTLVEDLKKQEKALQKR